MSNRTPQVRVPKPYHHTAAVRAATWAQVASHYGADAVGAFYAACHKGTAPTFRVELQTRSALADFLLWLAISTVARIAGAVKTVMNVLRKATLDPAGGLGVPQPLIQRALLDVLLVWRDKIL